MPASLASVLGSRGITVPTPIQAATLSDTMAGRDVLGCGRTGSGKTYAFLLPLVTRLGSSPPPRRRAPRALILAPTRELVRQIELALTPLARVAGLSSVSIFGGVNQRPQVRALRAGVDVLIACPGRLEDLIQQGCCSLAGIEVTVLDEADHMTDLGFLPAVQRLLAQTPPSGQRMLFSATLDRGVGALMKRFLHHPIMHNASVVEPAARATSHHVLHLDQDQRFPVLMDLTSAPGQTLVFTRTKHRAKALSRQLNIRGVAAVELHGDLSQNIRTKNLEAFHAGRVGTLVATDIAARGIHVDDVSLVVHADPPVESKAYMHRSGRTGRAGNVGTVITLTTDTQLDQVRALTRTAGVRVTTTHVSDVTDPILAELAPGERVLTRPATDPPRGAEETRPNPRPRSHGSSARSTPSSRDRRPASPPNRPARAPQIHSAAGFSGRRRAR